MKRGNFTFKCFVSEGKKLSLFFWSSFSKFPWKLSSNFLLVLIRRNGHLTELQQKHWVHICLSWQAHSHQVHNVQVPENFDHIHSFFVNLPCWKFHENASLPFQVFGAGASRARLHRNLPTSFSLGIVSKYWLTVTLWGKVITQNFLLTSILKSWLSLSLPL